MTRVFGFLTALVALGIILSATSAQQPGAPAAAPSATSAARPTVAVFNMAAVMREFNKAKYQVYLLSKMKIDQSKNLVAWRGEMIKLNQTLQATTDPAIKGKIEKDLYEYKHRYETEERDVNKHLQDEASKIISKLYDEIKMVVDKTADMNAFQLVFAFPDAVTPEEQSNPYLKELKLKPPAAQPFYVSKQVDITGVVIQTLNSWYPPVDEKGQKVDVAKLPKLESPATAAPARPGAPAGALGGPRR